MNNIPHHEGEVVALRAMNGGGVEDYVIEADKTDLE